MNLLYEPIYLSYQVLNGGVGCLCGTASHIRWTVIAVAPAVAPTTTISTLPPSSATLTAAAAVTRATVAMIAAVATRAAAAVRCLVAEIAEFGAARGLAGSSGFHHGSAGAPRQELKPYPAVAVGRQAPILKPEAGCDPCRQARRQISTVASGVIAVKVLAAATASTSQPALKATVGTTVLAPFSACARA